MVAHAFNPSTKEAEVGRSLSSRPARAIMRPYLENQPTNPNIQSNLQMRLWFTDPIHAYLLARSLRLGN